MKSMLEIVASLKVTFLLTMAVLMALFSACQTVRQSSDLQVKPASNKNSYLIVAVNGRSSCRIPQWEKTFPKNQPLHKPGILLANELYDQGSSAEWLQVCSYQSEMFRTPSGMRVKVAGKKGQFVGIRKVRQLPAAIAKYANGRRIIVIGHSYGGWVALYMAQHTKARYFSLYTIDAISPFNCNLSSYVLQNRQKKRDVERYLASDPSCRKFPTDINGKTVRRNVENWVNFFQRQGAIASNKSKWAENSYHYLNSETCGHRYMGANPPLWQTLIAITKAGHNPALGTFSDRYDLLLPYTGEPKLNNGGECNGVLDIGSDWSHVSDRPTEREALQRRGLVRARFKTIAPEEERSLALPEGLYHTNEPGFCTDAKISRIPSGQIRIEYFDDDTKSGCSDISGVFQCNGNQCQGELLTKTGEGFESKPYSFKVNDDRLSFEDVGATYMFVMP